MLHAQERHVSVHKLSNAPRESKKTPSKRHFGGLWREAWHQLGSHRSYMDQIKAPYTGNTYTMRIPLLEYVHVLPPTLLELDVHVQRPHFVG